jgi:hypothetical protein
LGLQRRHRVERHRDEVDNDQGDDESADNETRPVSDRAMLQDRIELMPEICSAPNMSRHVRFPTSARYFPVDYVAGQWDFEGMPVIARAPVKVLAAYKWVQAKW